MAKISVSDTYQYYQACHNQFVSISHPMNYVGPLSNNISFLERWERQQTVDDFFQAQTLYNKIAGLRLWVCGSIELVTEWPMRSLSQHNTDRQSHQSMQYPRVHVQCITCIRPAYLLVGFGAFKDFEDELQVIDCHQFKIFWYKRLEWSSLLCFTSL